MKYAFIQQHRRLWPVSVQCRVLRVSAAGYHAHLARRASGAQRRHLSDEALLVHIKAVHAETRSAYGSCQGRCRQKGINQAAFWMV